MRIVDFEIGHPILRETLRRVPGAEVEWIQSDIGGSDGEASHRLLLWVRGDDYAAFEAALDDDPTVSEILQSVEVTDRRLYQLAVTPDGTAKSIYPVIVNEGAILRSLRGSADGWQFQVAFPHDSAASRFFDFCDENHLPFTIHRMFTETTDRPAGLSDIQHDTLRMALEAGYFDVPRKNSLIDLAERLDISDTAVSQRLRRGLRTLVSRYVESGDQHAEETRMEPIDRD